MRFLLGILILLLASSCEKLEHKSDFEKSLDSWQQFKKANNNSYKYVTARGTWVGISWATELRVESGVITERKFWYSNYGPILRPEGGWDEESSMAVLKEMKLTAEEFEESRGKSILEELQWVETYTELGKHTSTAASELLTLDQIYDLAKNKWLVRRDKVTTYFEAKHDGLLSGCGYTENNCADDCYIGVTIKSIEKL